MSDIHNDLAHELAKDAAKRVAQSAMSYLIQSKHTLSAEDSGLANTWEEICVQVQDCMTYYWEAYEAAMRDAVLSAMMSLDEQEIVSIWLQTGEGERWSQSIGNPNVDLKLEQFKIDRAVIPVEDEVVSEYIISQYLEPMAFDYLNPNIQAFLNPDDDILDD